MAKSPLRRLRVAASTASGTVMTTAIRVDSPTRDRVGHIRSRIRLPTGWR